MTAEKIRVRASMTSGGRPVLLVLSGDTLTCSNGLSSGRTLFAVPLGRLEISNRSVLDGRRFIKYVLFVLVPALLVALVLRFNQLAGFVFFGALIGSLALAPGVLFRRRRATRFFLDEKDCDTRVLEVWHDPENTEQLDRLVEEVNHRRGNPAA